jgi:hypothetical protein
MPCTFAPSAHAVHNRQTTTLTRLTNRNRLVAPRYTIFTSIFARLCRLASPRTLTSYIILHCLFRGGEIPLVSHKSKGSIIQRACPFLNRAINYNLFLRLSALANYDMTPLYGKSQILDAFIGNMDRSISARVTRFLHITRQ